MRKEGRSARDKTISQIVMPELAAQKPVIACVRQLTVRRDIAVTLSTIIKKRE
jgi:hypothetical protein